MRKLLFSLALLCGLVSPSVAQTLNGHLAGNGAITYQAPAGAMSGHLYGNGDFFILGAPTFVQTNPVDGQCFVYASSSQTWVNGNCGGGSSGTVTSVSVVTANGLSGTVATATTTPAITLAPTFTGIAFSSGSALQTAIAANFPTLNQNTTGNAATSTALAATPAQCSSGQYATGVTALGACNSAQVQYSQLGGTPAVGLITDAQTSLLVKPSVTAVCDATCGNLTLSGAQTVDGQVCTVGTSMFLLTAQTAGAQNGPWVCQTAAWTRPPWYPTGGTTQGLTGSTTLSRNGTLYGGTLWKMTTTGAITIDTTVQAWSIVPFRVNASSVANGVSGTGAVVLASAVPAAANPSGLIGLVASNGVAVTFERSDATHGLDQTIVPGFSSPWTGAPWTWSNAEPRLALVESDQGTDLKAWDFDVNAGVLTGRTRTDADGAGVNWLAVTRGTTTAIASISLGNVTNNPAINLLGTGAVAVGGPVTFGFTAGGGVQTVNLSNNLPTLFFKKLNGAVDAKTWGFDAGGNPLRIYAQNDAASVTREILDVTRSGVALTLLAFGNATDNPAYTFLGTGTTTVGSTAVVLVSGGSTAAPTLQFGSNVTGTWGNSSSMHFVVGGSELANFQSSGGSFIAGKLVTNGSFWSAGTKFVATGCTNSGTLGGGIAGSYVSGTTGTCTVTITLPTGPPNGYSCYAHDDTTAADYTQSAIVTATTTLTITGTTVSGDKISFACIGN